MRMNVLDRLMGYLSPQRAVERLKARSMLDTINSLVGGQAGYDAGKLSRLTAGLNRQKINENAVPLAQLEMLQSRSWDLYRNNPSAKKIVRQIEAKVIGKGMGLESLATKDDGSPHLEFRKRAKELWQALASGFDYRGLPGKGGQSFNDLAKTALRATILSGNSLNRLRPISQAKQKARNLAIPLVLQLIDAQRLDTRVFDYDGNDVYRGVEINADGVRLAYHILPFHPTDPRNRYSDMTPKRMTVAEINHTFISDDVDQVLGVPWFSAAIDPLRDTGDYQYNELKAAAMGACIVMGIRPASGSSGIGLNVATDGEITDADGNAITHISPGMIVNLGADGVLDGFNPQRPNTNASDFIAHLLRNTATAVPGVKGSTLTGDYRQSSFASERSADNEIWPEIEGVQEWWAGVFYQPIYQEVLLVAILSGWFDGVITLDEFVERRSAFVAAQWQGPVARSINPSDDEEASALAVRNGTSSPQLECAKKGRNWIEITQQIKEYIDHVLALDIPEWAQQQLIMQTIGVASAVDDSSATKPVEGESKDGTSDNSDTAKPKPGKKRFELPAAVRRPHRISHFEAVP